MQDDGIKNPKKKQFVHYWIDLYEEFSLSFNGDGHPSNMQMNRKIGRQLKKRW
jgi:hypothetical protein